MNFACGTETLWSHIWNFWAKMATYGRVTWLLYHLLYRRMVGRRGHIYRCHAYETRLPSYSRQSIKNSSASRQSWVNARLVHSVHWNEWENNSLLFTTHTNKSHGNKSGFLISSAMTHKVESANDCMHPGVLFSLWCCWQQLYLQWPKCWWKKANAPFLHTLENCQQWCLLSSERHCCFGPNSAVSDLEFGYRPISVLEH